MGPRGLQLSRRRSRTSRGSWSSESPDEPSRHFRIDTPGDAARAAELRRVKLLATPVLAATFAIFLGAKALLPVHPVFGFHRGLCRGRHHRRARRLVRRGGAVQRPLGLPIPHTAIIQSNQHRIADKLGEFIEVHFLEAAPVEAKLRQIDFGSFIADWLRDRKRSEDLARFALRLLPEAVAATENSGLMTFVSRRITAQLMAIDLAPLAAGRCAASSRRAAIRSCSTISCAACIRR